MRVKTDAEAMEVPVTGFDHADCDPVAHGTHAAPHRVQWDGEDLSALDAREHLRLEFKFTRPAGGDVSPALYEWWAADAQTEYALTPDSEPAEPMAPIRGDGRRL